MAEIDTDLIPSIRQALDIELPDNTSLEVLKEKLSVYINNLIQSDFEKLVSLLYRIDVNEPKLKQLLQQNPGEDAGKIIAELIIERQLQKIKFRQQISKPDNYISDEEAW
jgi:hypothetical protein